MFRFILYWVWGRILDKAFSLHYCLIQNCSWNEWFVMNDKHATKPMQSWHHKALRTFTKCVMVFSRSQIWFCVDIRLYKIIPRNSQLGARMHFYTASVMCRRWWWWRWSPSAKQVLAQFVHELINSHLITTVLQKCLTSAGHLLCCSCTCDLVTGCNTKSDTSAQPALCF